MNTIKPLINHWYVEEVLGRFEVVAIDDDGSIEIQYADGEIGELDLETWCDSNITEVAEPDDCFASYEVSHEDMSNYIDDAMYSPAAQQNPLLFIEPEDHPYE